MSVDRKCKHCGLSFKAKAADVKRGWARFCSKSCKARQQTNHDRQQWAGRYKDGRDGIIGMPAHSQDGEY